MQATEILDEELDWASANLPMLRRWATGLHFLREALMLVFMLGLAAQVGGYGLRNAASGEPLGLIAELLATLGATLWTGVVLVALVEVLPETRRRWLGRRLEAYESALRGSAGLQGNLDTRQDGDAGAPEQPSASTEMRSAQDEQGCTTRGLFLRADDSVRSERGRADKYRWPTEETTAEPSVEPP